MATAPFTLPFTLLEVLMRRPLFATLQAEMCSLLWFANKCGCGYELVLDPPEYGGKGGVLGAGVR